VKAFLQRFSKSKGLGTVFTRLRHVNAIGWKLAKVIFTIQYNKEVCSLGGSPFAQSDDKENLDINQ